MISHRKLFSLSGFLVAALILTGCRETPAPTTARATSSPTAAVASTDTPTPLPPATPTAGAASTGAHPPLPSPSPQLAPFTDPNGLFTIQYPARFIEVQPIEGIADYGYQFQPGGPEGQPESLLVLFFDVSAPEKEDAFWQTTFDDIQTWLFGFDPHGDLQFLTDRQEHSLLVIEITAKDNSTRGLMGVWDPQEGVIALFAWAAAADLWTEPYLSLVNQSLFSLDWSPWTARSLLDRRAASTPVPAAAPEPLTAAAIDRLSEIARLPLRGRVLDLDWSPDGRRLALALQSDASAPPLLTLFDAQTLTPIDLPAPVQASRLAFSPDGRFLAAAFTENLQDHLAVWETAHLLEIGATSVSTFTDSFGGIFGLTFSPDSRLIALAVSAAKGSIVPLVAIETGQVVQTLDISYQGTHAPLVQDVAFSPDGALVAGAAYGGTVQLWQVADGRPVVVIKAEVTQPNRVAFLTAGRFVTTGFPTARIWSIDGALLAELPGPASPSLLAVAPDGRLVMGVAGDRIDFWDADSGQIVRSVMAASPVTLLDFGPPGRLAVVDEAGTLHMWAVGQGDPLPDAPPLPTPTPSPAPTATEAASELSALFVSAWQKLTRPSERLGQPLGTPIAAEIIVHRFRYGLMVEGVRDREGWSVVLTAIYGESGDIFNGTEWYMLETDWQPGQPEYPCPETSPPGGPRQRIGQVWCQYAELRQRLGVPFDARQVASGGYQHYQTGLLVWIPGQGILALSGQGMWEMVLE